MTDSIPTPVAFADQLLEQAEDAALRKSARTRLKLLASTAQLLEERSYPQLRAGDISLNANMSYGVLYHYFNDKSEITTELMKAFVAQLTTMLGAASHADVKGRDAYVNIYLANLSYIEHFRVNRGLFRVLMTQNAELPEVRTVRQKLSNDWHNKIGKTVQPPPGERKLKPTDQLMAGYLLGGMPDELLSQVFLLENENVKSLGQTRNLKRLCEIMTVMWYRAVFGKEPSKTSLKAAQKINVERRKR